MSAALGFSQLSRIDRLLAARNHVASLYEEMLHGIPGVKLLAPMPTNAQPSRFVFVVRLHETIDRDRVIADLRDRGVPTRTYFSPIHLQPFFMDRFGYREGDLPVTERVANSALALPFHGNMPLADVEYVVQSLKEATARRAH